MYDTTKPYKNQILELIKSSWETPYVSVKNGVVEKKFCLKEFHHTDGIGTKGIYHWKQKSLRNAVLDSLAMNLNDLPLARAKPYALIDHLFLPNDNEENILEIMSCLTEECKKRNIAITGGETAIHSNMNEIEMSITMLGFIENEKQNKFKIKDNLIGIKSSGLHSNGFTKLREVFGEEYKPEFIVPTKIYSDAILDLNEKYDIHGMMHITGGAYTKLKDLLDNSDAVIENHLLKPQIIFYNLYLRGVSAEEMYKTFNCGVGFILSAAKKDSNKIISELKKSDLESCVIGEIVRGSGKIKIQSVFNNKELVL
ncbi:MAG: AIR synthase-related protein [Nanoarchaeota archaeon]|nr:AIR synthase-related protein [Nanoarchaeota archaeon]